MNASRGSGGPVSTGLGFGFSFPSLFHFVWSLAPMFIPIKNRDIDERATPGWCGLFHYGTPRLTNESAYQT